MPKELYFRLRLKNAAGEASIDFPWNVLMAENTRNMVADAAFHSEVNGVKNDTTVELFLITGRQEEPEGYEGVAAFGEDVRDFVSRWFQ